MTIIKFDNNDHYSSKSHAYAYTDVVWQDKDREYTATMRVAIHNGVLQVGIYNHVTKQNIEATARITEKRFLVQVSNDLSWTPCYQIGDEHIWENSGREKEDDGHSC